MVGHVYSIICIVDSSIVYIGSTFKNLQERMQKHIFQYKYYISDKYNNYSIYKYFEKYGCDNFRIKLLQSYDVPDKKSLVAYEQLYINMYRYDKYIKCININMAFNPLGKLNVYCWCCTRYIQHKSYNKHINTDRCINNRLKT